VDFEPGAHTLTSGNPESRVPNPTRASCSLRARINASDTPNFFHRRVVRAFSYGTELLTYIRSVFGYAAAGYRKRYESTFVTDHAKRLVLFAQKFAPLILPDRITARIVNLPSSKLGRFEWKCAV
jgi:hypothetical protein